MRKMVCLLVSFILISANLLSLPTDKGISNTAMAQEREVLPGLLPPYDPNDPNSCDKIIKRIRELYEEGMKLLDEAEKALKPLTKSQRFRQVFKGAWERIEKKAIQRLGRAIIFTPIPGVGPLIDLWLFISFIDEVSEALMVQDLLLNGFPRDEAERIAEEVSDQIFDIHARWQLETGHPIQASITKLHAEIEKFLEKRPMCFVGITKPPKTSLPAPKIPSGGGGGTGFGFTGGGKGGGSNGGLVPCHKVCVEVYDPQTGKIDRECDFVCG
jgi:hypothetical protein